MIFLLDTNAVSDSMARHAVLDQHLASIDPNDRVVTCSIVRGEIMYGVECLPAGRRKDGLRATATATLDNFRCELVPPQAGDIYGRLKATSEQGGAIVDENDLWIAATALAIGAIVITRDGHFATLTEVRVEDWTQ